jgi:site-specific DNA recombinase
MNCALYARVSTGKQAAKELSLPAQLQLMRDYATQKGWVVAAEYIEPGATGKHTNRPALQRLLAAIEEGRSGIGVVLVHKIDRFARYVFDHTGMKELFKKHGVSLASVSEHLEDTPSGHLVEHVMASVAQFYSENLSDEVKKGMRQKVLKGGWPHLPPRGYVLVKSDTDRTSRVVLHPLDGPLLRRAFEQYATGLFSLKQLAASLKQQGVTAARGQPLAPAQLQRILSNSFYVARLKWKDLDVPAQHEALVSPELFQRVQATLRERARTPGAKGSVHGFPLRGLAICASCRGHMTASWHKKRWGYYHCARRGYNKGLCDASSYCSATIAHQQIDQLCQTLRLSQIDAKKLLAASRRLVEQQTTQMRHRLESLRAKRSNLAGRELRLTESFVSGDVSPAAYKLAAAKIRNAIEALETTIHTIERDPSKVIARVESVVSQAQSLADLRNILSERRRVELLRTVFARVVLDHNGVVGFTLRPQFESFFTMGDGARSTNGSRDETVVRAVVDHAMTADADMTHVA